jgi:hypothetical protein
LFLLAQSPGGDVNLRIGVDADMGFLLFSLVSRMAYPD